VNLIHICGPVLRREIGMKRRFASGQRNGPHFRTRHVVQHTEDLGGCQLAVTRKTGVNVAVGTSNGYATFGIVRDRKV
jgi:hypothetical protein